MEDTDELQDNYTIDCKALTLARFYQRVGCKRLMYTTDNPVASSAMSLANAIDDNIWFPQGSRSPGSNLFGYVIQMHIRNAYRRMKEPIQMQINNWITHLMKPLYSLQKVEDDTFDLMRYGTNTPIAVVFPNPGEPKYSGFAVCGSWIYNVMGSMYTLPVMQKNLLELKYLHIVNRDGTVERRKKQDEQKMLMDLMGKAVTNLESSTPPLEEMTKRLEDAIARVESYKTEIKKLAKENGPPTNNLTATPDHIQLQRSLSKARMERRKKIRTHQRRNQRPSSNLLRKKRWRRKVSPRFLILLHRMKRRALLRSPSPRRQTPNQRRSSETQVKSNLNLGRSWKSSPASIITCSSLTRHQSLRARP